MKILRELGVENLLVESPTVTHIFMEEEMMDELFLNQSGIYVGGDALSVGNHNQPFTSFSHPHSRLLSIHMHSAHFIYMRYKLIYS
jgi:riboflavin biosynthesis pyrimidine reductase